MNIIYFKSIIGDKNCLDAVYEAANLLDDSLIGAE